MDLPAKLICAITYNNKVDFNIIKNKLIEAFGEIDFIGENIFFSEYTNYYKKEMGDNLSKTIVSFKDNIKSLEDAYKYKLISIKIEKELSENDNRNVNLDTGYLTRAKFILFTTKNFIHRIYLRGGIYAEITLSFNKKINSYDRLPTSYPDYTSKEMISNLNIIRNYLLESK